MLAPSPKERDDAELKVLVYLHLLRHCYKYATVVSYFSDLKNLQRRYSHGLALAQLNQTLSRCKLLLSVYRKEMPTLTQQKRPWSPEYFHHIKKGMRWDVGGAASLAGIKHRHRVVWTVMVFMFEHLLRLGEVVDTRVARQAARRPWSLSNVSFWVGARKVRWSEGGEPDPADRFLCTHALVEVQPSKTDAAGEKFDPLVCPFPSEGDLLAACGGAVGVAGAGWMFATGPLLWDMLTLDPVQRAFAETVPLFRSEAAGPPTFVHQLTQNEFVVVFHLLCRSASPRVPVFLLGKRLGGHCMRVAGCNFAAATGASVLDIANLGRWGAFAFRAAGGYDYMRTNRSGMHSLSMKMVVGLAALPGASSMPTQVVVLTWGSVEFLGYAVVACGVVLVLTAFGAGVVARHTTAGVWTWVSGRRQPSPRRVTFSTEPPGVGPVWRQISSRGDPVVELGALRGGPWVGAYADDGGVGEEPTAVMPLVVPSAPVASGRDWRDWVQDERAAGLAEYHARITAARGRRQQGLRLRQPRTLR